MGSVNFTSLEITPHVVPLLDLNAVSYNLVDGVQYTLSYQNTNCTNRKYENITMNGMYYLLPEQPKCRLSLVDLYLYNYNSSPVQVKSVQHGLQSITDEKSCTINAMVVAKNSSSYPSPNDIKVSHSMCGFSNGSITINTSIYSSIVLKSPKGLVVSPTSNGHFSGLSDGVYTLLVTSDSCGLEFLTIEVKKVYSQIGFNLLSFKNYYDNSTMKFTFPSNEINSSIANVFLSGETVIPSKEWSSHKDVFSIDTFSYGFKYNYDLSPNTVESSNMCKQSESIYTSSIRPNVDYTVIKPSSCKDNVTITFSSNYENDELTIETPQNAGYSIINNQLTSPYNNYFVIKSKKGNSKLSFNIPFVDIKYKIEEVTNETQCWKQYNITVLNHQLFETLRIESNNHGLGYTLYPVNGVFSNVAANRLKLLYKTSDCENESYLYILEQLPTPQEKITAEYKILKNSSCTQDATVGFTIHTPLGSYSSNFTTSSSYNNYYSIPNSYCYFEVDYQLPPTIVNDLQVTADSCTGNILNITSDYPIASVTVNGALIYGTLQVYPGENNITAEFINGRFRCYRSKTLNIVQNPSNANVYITPVENCNSIGSIRVDSYQDYDSITLVSGVNEYSLVDGFIEAKMGDYTLKFQTSTCLYTKSISVGGNIVPTITTKTIREPTCSDNYGDGIVSVSLSTDNYGDIYDFEIIDLQDNSFYNRILPGCKTGINNFKIRYNNCLWNASHNLSSTIDDPLIGLEFYYNTTDCTVNNIYKVISNNSNVNIHSVSNLQYANSLLYDKLNYYITSMNDDSVYVAYDVTWNAFCKKSFQTTISKNKKYNNAVNYQVVLPDDCSSTTMDVIITNMNMFVSGSVLISNKQPTYINSTHSIFKNLIVTEGYLSISHTLLNGCSGNSGVSVPYGYVNIPLNYTLSNEVCYGSNGKIKIENFDSTNYYYRLISPNTDGNTIIGFNSDGEFSNLSALVSYKLLRINKNYGYCKTITFFSISTDEPKIQSITVVNPSNREYNNGSIQVSFNFVPSSVTYEVVVINSEGSVSSDDFNANTLTNVPPGTYQIKATVHDSYCPVTLYSEYITILSDSPSSSTIIKFNSLLIILSIVILLLK